MAAGRVREMYMRHAIKTPAEHVLDLLVHDSRVIDVVDDTDLPASHLVDDVERLPPSTAGSIRHGRYAC